MGSKITVLPGRLVDVFMADKADWPEILKVAALEILGQPVERRGTEWRYGRRGSLVVNIGGQRAGSLARLRGRPRRRRAGAAAPLPGPRQTPGPRLAASSGPPAGFPPGEPSGGDCLHQRPPEGEKRRESAPQRGRIRPPGRSRTCSSASS